MNSLEIKSLAANLDKSCKDLTDSEMVSLTNFLLYDCYEKEPNKWIADFIDDFFDKEEWDKNLADKIKKPEYFLRASRNTQELIRVVRVAVLEKTFNRTAKLVEKEPKVKLNKGDKNTLSEIFCEYKAMLEYQLEDEDELTRYCNEEECESLLTDKKRQLKFLNKFGNLKFI